MFSTLVGSRLPPRFQRFFRLPERPESWKVDDAGDSVLGRAVSRWFADRVAAAGVYRLDTGTEALAARVGLIDRAERTIDIQTYLIKDDLSGNLIALHLAAAADRGVRVRLLMDDAFTEEVDPGLLSLHDHDKIEVRVFNPFPRRRSRLISLLANFNILNRRMHNKSFTVDNQVTVVGGRNIADEYYQTGGDAEFIDEDLLLIGPPVEEVSDGFDAFWNAREAIPMGAFAKQVAHTPVAESLQEARKYVERHPERSFIDDIETGIIDALVDGGLELVAAEVEVVQDRPEMVRNLIRRRPSATSQYLQRMVAAARNELIIISPYFVPQKPGVEFFGALAKSGVRVVIISNSLASTNHTSVHAVYARYRKPLLKQGVELYELRPYAEAMPTRTRLTLHSKVATVDRERLFVGSFNVDPRSLYINTEMALSVASPVLAGTMADSILDSLPDYAYKLQLSASGRLQWLLQTAGVEELITTEPQTSIWRRLLTRLLSLLPIEEQM